MIYTNISGIQKKNRLILAKDVFKRSNNNLENKGGLENENKIESTTS